MKVTNKKLNIFKTLYYLFIVIVSIMIIVVLIYCNLKANERVNKYCSDIQASNLEERYIPSSCKK